MAALIGNVYIDSEVKFELFCRALGPLANIFEEYHLKVRGGFGAECIQYAESLNLSNFKQHQDLPEKNWVNSTKLILEQVGCTNIFLFLEDHLTVASSTQIVDVVSEFEKESFDYLNYSFFQACALQRENLLPLNPKIYKNTTSFKMDHIQSVILRSISPHFFLFGLTAIVSKSFFRNLLDQHSTRFFIHSKVFSHLLVVCFGQLLCRRLIQWLNGMLRHLNIRVFFYNPQTPFDLEKHISEYVEPLFHNYQIGIPNYELCANWDDDNGIYGESLIKRGLFPKLGDGLHTMRGENCVSFEMHLEAGQERNLLYFSRHHRISNAPVVQIQVISGKCTVTVFNELYELETGHASSFFANHGPILTASADSLLKVEVYDECFRS